MTFSISPSKFGVNTSFPKFSFISSKLLHPVIHLHVFNSKGELYLQKRPDWKDIQPGKWDTSVGGHIDLGESVDIALRRETQEELGITDFMPEKLTSYMVLCTKKSSR